MRRTNVVKLVVDEETHEKLKELGIITAKCWIGSNFLMYLVLQHRSL